MATKQQVFETHMKHPDWPYQSIAAHLGCMEQYVYATFRRAGMAVPKKPRNSGPDPAKLRARAANLIRQAEEIEARQARGR